MTTTSFRLTSEGADRTASWTVSDKAGNSATDSVTGINIDKTKPTISASVAPAANLAGWNNTDAASGIASCRGPSTHTSEGDHGSVTGTAIDFAGNTSTAAVTGINVDTPPPDLYGIPVDPTVITHWHLQYTWLNTEVQVDFVCGDTSGEGDVNYLETFVGVGEVDGFMRQVDGHFHYNLKTGEGGVWPEDTIGRSMAYILKVIVVYEATGNEIAQAAANLEARQVPRVRSAPGERADC